MRVKPVTCHDSRMLRSVVFAGCIFCAVFAFSTAACGVPRQYKANLLFEDSQFMMYLPASDPSLEVGDYLKLGSPDKPRALGVITRVERTFAVARITELNEPVKDGELVFVVDKSQRSGSPAVAKSAEAKEPEARPEKTVVKSESDAASPKVKKDKFKESTAEEEQSTTKDTGSGSGKTDNKSDDKPKVKKDKSQASAGEPKVKKTKYSEMQGPGYDDTCTPGDDPSCGTRLSHDFRGDYSGRSLEQDE